MKSVLSWAFQMQLDFAFLMNENKGHWRKKNHEKPFCKNINTVEFKVSDLLGLYNTADVRIQVENKKQTNRIWQVVEFLFDFLSDLRIQDRQPVNKSPSVCWWKFSFCDTVHTFVSSFCFCEIVHH
jgi:hypothetical protein